MGLTKGLKLTSAVMGQTCTTWWDALRRTQHHFCDIPTKKKSESYHKETSDKLKLRDVPPDNWLVIFKSVKVTKIKEDRGPFTQCRRPKGFESEMYHVPDSLKEEENLREALPLEAWASVEMLAFHIYRLTFITLHSYGFFPLNLSSFPISTDPTNFIFSGIMFLLHYKRFSGTAHRTTKRKNSDNIKC